MIDRNAKDVRVNGGRGAGEISELVVEFILPGAGMFGRDKNVAISEASAAKVSYVKDSARVTEQQVTVGEAEALVAQAERDEQAAKARADEARQRKEAEAEEVARKVADLTCTVCGGKDFDEETSREDSEMGYSSFKMRTKICRRCGFVMQFLLGRSMFVPGGNRSNPWPSAGPWPSTGGMPGMNPGMPGMNP